MCDQKKVWIFVYGTLKKGFPLYQGKEVEVVNDSVQGSLFSLVDFPALVLGRLFSKGITIEPTSVSGERHLVSEEVVRTFDRIEGDMYTRTEMVTDSGVPVQSYIFNLIEYLRLENYIEEGNWSIDNHTPRRCRGGAS